MFKPIGWGLIVTSVALVLIVGTAPFVGAGNGARAASDSEVVLIRNLSARGEHVQGPLSSLRATVLETYPSFLLVSLDRGQREDLAKWGFEVIELKDRTRTGRGAFVFDTRHGEPTLPDALRIDPRENPEYDVYLVQFIGPVKSAWVEGLRAAGAEVFAYLPSYSYIAAMDRGALVRVRRLAFVQWTGLYQPAYKISPALLGTSREPTVVSLGLLPGRSPERAESIIAASGGEVTDRWTVAREPWLRASVSGQVITDLARLSEVAWIEEYTPPSFFNEQATQVVQSFAGGPRTVHIKGLEGQDQLVTMTDTGPDIAHFSFRDHEGDPIGPDHRKIQACDTWPNCVQVIVPCKEYESGVSQAHGTLVAGVIAGDAPDPNLYDGHDGHAFRSRLIVQDGSAFNNQCTPSNYYGEMFAPSYQKGSRIHTNSWGTTGGSYCIGAKQTDQFVRDNPDYLVIFAAGNDGDQGISCEARAKNIITVGASLNGSLSNEVWPQSGRGPAGSDGRRKPTVMAPGADVCSAIPPPWIDPNTRCIPGEVGYSRVSGTSFAAPAVAGSAALVRQYFTEGWYPAGVKPDDPNGSPALIPSAALIKAVLVNGAVKMTGPNALGKTCECIEDCNCRRPPCSTECGTLCCPFLGGTYPNNIQGWGRIHLDNSLYFADDSRKLLVFDVDAGTQFTGTGQAFEHSVVVDPNSQPLEVTLVWTDVAAEVGAVPAIVNDLDLIVRDPNGTGFNLLDHVNVEENVLVENPGAGVWTIRVEAHNVPVGGHPYGLVVTGGVSCPPGAQETCNGVDDDCNGLRDEGFPNLDNDMQPDCTDSDDDGDGHLDVTDCAPLNPNIHPGATEGPSTLSTCFDGVDNDCDGQSDMDCAVDITVDVHPNGQITVVGQVVSGHPVDLHSLSFDDTYEQVREGGSASQKKLTKIWTVQDTANGVAYNLKVEGYRNSTAGSDNFVFSYATRASGSCTANQAWSGGILTVSKTADDDQLQTGTMGVASPVFCIRVQDSKPTNDSQVDNLFLDRVYLFPTP